MSSSPALPAAAAEWIRRLGLQPHPEGGYYREVSRGNWVTKNSNGAHRFAYTTIYFLLTSESPSHLHRIQADEVWLHHAGDPIDVHVILRHPEDEQLCAVESGMPPVDPSDMPLHHPYVPPHITTATTTMRKEYEVYKCVSVGQIAVEGAKGGEDEEEGPLQLQYTVPRGAIFGSTLAKKHRTHGFTLVSCVVAPGFNFKDFEVFTQAELMKICPQHQSIISELAYATLPASP